MAFNDDRLGVVQVQRPKTYVVDYSSPNVAKPMHVGHIRSTVIGDAICRLLRFVGHRVIGDNHLGDWGTQFGMVIYGFKHFLDQAEYAQNPVGELGRLYKQVNRLVEYADNKDKRQAEFQAKVVQCQADLADGQSVVGNAADRKLGKSMQRLEQQLTNAIDQLETVAKSIRQVEADPALSGLARSHPNIRQAVLAETAKLHAGDEENLRLWTEFMHVCREDLQRIYGRLNIRFDYEYGESFYHDRLAAVVDRLVEEGLAVESDGAVCIFVDGFETPLLIRKKDGAFLYATSDLAAIDYRLTTWQADGILYVVDHRQSDHFEKLFAAARMRGCTGVQLHHVGFGTVTDEHGKPYKTRSGDTVGLEGLLDEAVGRAYAVVCSNDDAKPSGRELTDEQREQIADVIGHAAIKYADLSHNRTSDYVFNIDKMVAMQGNTATYMQYSYARSQSILAKANVDICDLRKSGKITITNSHERELALELLRFEEALYETALDYRPNRLTEYMFGLASKFAKFYEQCPVLKAEHQGVGESRLLLCDLTGRTIKQGLAILGIGVVERM